MLTQLKSDVLRLKKIVNQRAVSVHCIPIHHWLANVLYMIVLPSLINAEDRNLRYFTGSDQSRHKIAHTDLSL